MSPIVSPLRLPPRRYTLLDGIRIPLLCAPVAATLWALFWLVSAAVTPLGALAAARFIDAAIASVRVGHASSEVWHALVLVAAIAAFQWLERALRNIVDLRLTLRLRERYRTALTMKRARMDYRHTEDGDTWDLIQRIAVNPEGGRLKDSYVHLVDLVAFVIKVGGLLTILTSIVWWAGLVVVLISALTLVTGIRGGKIQYEAERRAAGYEKRVDYFSTVLLGREAAEERTLFGYTEFVAGKWRNAFLTALGIRMRARIRWYVSAYLGNFIAQASWIFVMIVLLPPLRSGEVTVGLFIALTQAFTNLNIVWDFMETVNGLSADAEFFKDLTAFLGLSDIPQKKERRTAGGPAGSGARDLPARDLPARDFVISLQDVSFSYPGSDRSVLEGLSYAFERGRHYALVGANGAGKSTLVKLLTGLYRTDAGTILLDGVPVDEYDESAIARAFSVVYQDFARYQLSIRGNVLLGADDRDDEVLSHALSEAGLSDFAVGLPGGVDTPIGKLYEDGIDLSGGQWQRLAVARCLARRAPVRILDEPAAALDPIAESELYELFDRASAETTTILISHRLGATTIADEILVLDRGQIAESGSHEALIARGGLYAEMYESQRRWYEPR